MAKFINNVKLGWLKGVEGIGTFASNLASNAKFKMAEINLETRRREVMAEFTQKAYDLWQTGTQLPEQLSSMLQEACDLDERLSLLRAQRYANLGGEGEKEKQGKGQGSEDVKEDGAATASVAELPQESQPEPAYSAPSEEKQEQAMIGEGQQEQEL